jgi:hypothetical protein
LRPDERVGPLTTGLLVSRAHRPSRAARLLLAVVAGLVAGTSIGAVAAARRADGSADRFARWYRPEDLNVVANPELPHDQALAALTAVRRRSEVATSMRLAVLVTRAHAGAVRSRSGRGAMVAEVDLDPPTPAMTRPRLLQGRLARPDRAGEVTINERLDDLLHVGVGDRISLDLFRAAEIDRIGNGIGGPPAATPRPVVVGIVRNPYDLERTPASQRGNLDEFNDARLYATPAFWQAHGPDLALYGFQLRVRLRPGTAIRKAFEQAVVATGTSITFPPDVFRDAAVVRRSTTTEAIALLVFAGLLGTVGFVLLGSAVRRAVAIDPDDLAVCRALGVSRGELVVAELVRVWPVVLGAAVVAVPTAVLVTPHAAFGLSRQAEMGSGAGVALTTGVVLVTGLVVLATTMLAGASYVAARRDVGRPAAVGSVSRAGGRLLGWMARVGAPPWSVAGVRMSLPLPGRAGNLVRSALATVAAGVALLVATTTFGASLHHLVVTPAARGWTWDVNVGNFSDATQSEAGRRALAADHDVAAFTGFDSQELLVDGHSTDVLGVEDLDVLDLPVSKGRLPSRRGEVAFTRDTAATLHRKIGDTVAITGFRGAKVPFEVVGETIGPGAVENDLDLRTGAIIGWDDLQPLAPSPVTLEQYAVRLRDGVDRDVARRGLRSSFGLAIFEPAATSGVASVERVQPLLVLFAGSVLVLAAGTLVHALAVALRRRRREVALLKALGFDRGEVGRTVVLQAVSLAAVGVVVGLPVGLVVGGWAWRVAARTIGVLSGPITPVAVPVAVVAVLLAAGAASIGPARRARRVPAAEVLRTE